MSGELQEKLKVAGRRYSNIRAFKDLKFAQEKEHLAEIIRIAMHDPKSKLPSCTVDSFASTILQAGSLGLSLNPMLKHCYVIPRRIQKNPDIWQAYASPSYRGLVHLLTTTGAIKRLSAEIVYKDDQFEYRGPMQLPFHSAILDPAKRTEANAIGVYVVAVMPDNGIQASYTDINQIQAARSQSKQPNSLMWTTFWTEAWIKCAIRRAWKTLPMSPLMLQVNHHLDEFEGITIEQGAEDAQIQTVTPDQIANMRQAITDQGHDADKWMQRLALRLGVKAPEAIPAPSYDEGMRILDSALKSSESAAGEA